MQDSRINEYKIITYLSPRLASFWSVKKILLPDEIRLTCDMPLVTVINGEAFVHGIAVKAEDIGYVLRVLSSNSMYAHSETLKEGYITSRDGIRAGVIGRATVSDGKIASVTGISSVVLRIPKRFYGASHVLCEYVVKNRFEKSVVICAPPSGGKTTALREFAFEIASKPYHVPAVLIDSRCEISTDSVAGTLCTMHGYPRAKGIEIAVRTLSPKLIITDEINSEDVAALAYSALSGVCFVASAHGTSESFSKSETWKALSECGKFVLCDIMKKPCGIEFNFKE